MPDPAPNVLPVSSRQDPNRQQDAGGTPVLPSSSRQDPNRQQDAGGTPVLPSSSRQDPNRQQDAGGTSVLPSSSRQDPNRQQDAGGTPVLPASSRQDQNGQGGDAGNTVHRALVGTAWVAGVFCAVLIAVMFVNHATATTNDPWKSPQLIALKEKLVAEPMNEPLKKEVRRLDFEFRKRYRHRLALDGLGGWLLLGGSLVLVVTARQASQLRRKLPMPQPNPDAAAQATKMSARARWCVAAAGVVVAGGLLAIAFLIRSVLPNSSPGWQKLLGTGNIEEGAAAVNLPLLAEFQTNWPRFRGWDGSGVSMQTNTPLSWDAKSGAGIVWKSAIPAPGHSSPIVWGNRVFISGGTAEKREAFCYDAVNGQLLWRRAVENVPGSPAKAPEVPEDTTYAAPTMATDGRHVFVFFANGDLAAFAFDGAIAWTKALGPLKNSYGHAASLAIWPGVLILQLDQGDSGPAGSKLVAFDPAKGKVLWERPRSVPASWATPIIGEAAGKTQIITFGKPWVIAYSLSDGNELWRADLLEGEIVPSPAVAGGLVLVASPSSKLLGLRPDGAGDVTKSSVAWSTDENVPDITGPVSSGEFVFTVTSGGTLTCFGAKDGKKVWEQDLKLDEVQASPSIVGNRVFVLGMKGVAVSVEAGRQFKEIARSELADKFQASPAFAGGRMYLRGATNLWCIGAKPAK